MALNGTRVSWKRIGICLALIFVGIWLLYPAVMHVMMWHYAQVSARDPRTAVMPQALTNTSLATLANGTELLSFGFTLRAPWPSLVKREDIKSLTILRFQNGAQLNIVDETNDIGPNMLVGKSPAEAATLKSLYGTQALRSKYDFLAATLNTSPQDVSFGYSRFGNLRTMMLLMDKSELVGKARNVYPVAFGDMRGFQIGDPAQGSQTVQLRLFDAKDDELWIVLHGPSTEGLTQEQINAMVASIRPPN